MDATQNTERWLPVPGWEGRYEVSDLGRVRSLGMWITNQFGAPYYRPGIIRALWTDPRGYVHATLYRGNTQRRQAVHQLVMRAFVGPAPAGLEVCHNDGIPGNNHLSNLRYDTHSANLLDKGAHGTAARGESNHRNRWTEDQVREMRRLYAQGLSQSQIAVMFGARQATIQAIVSRKTWAWLD